MQKRINLEDSECLLKLIGDEFLEYYITEVFSSQENIKLLIDENTFYIKCSSAVEKMNNLPKMNNLHKRDYAYEDCLEAFDAVQTNFEVYKNSSLLGNNQLIALSIAVFQVLLAYKELPENENPDTENGYYWQLKDNYPSIKKNDRCTDYFKNQIKLWEAVQELFQKNGKNLELPPSRTNGAYKNVQYPHFQRIVKPNEFRDLCSKFKTIDADKEYNFEEFSKIYSTQLQYLPLQPLSSQKNFILSLLYNAYNSWKKINTKQQYYSANDTALGILYFEKDGKLTDEYSELSLSDLNTNLVYFYKVDDSLWCTEGSDAETDVGLLINKKNYDNYKTLRHELIKTKDDDYIFLAIRIADIKNLGIYTKFFSKVKSISEKKYCIVNGLKLDGRSNTYDKSFLPDIIFDFPCSSVELKNVYGEKRFQITDNTLRLSLREIKNYYNGKITISVPENIIPPIEIIVDHPVDKEAKLENMPLGWNLETMAPTQNADINSLVGLHYSDTESHINQDDQDKKDSKESEEITLTYPYVNCNYTGPLYITEYEEIYSKLKELISQTVKKGESKPVGMIIESLKTRLGQTAVELHTYMSYYRLLKKCILDFYEEQTLFVIFYGSASGSDELKPYIKKVSYEPGVYETNKTYPYFENLQINGRRPQYTHDTTSLVISFDKVKTSLKHLTCDINYSARINSNIIQNEKYAYDYLEYYEVLLKIKSVKILMSPNGLFKIDLSEIKISDLRTSSEWIDFTRYQEIKDKDEKSFQNNDPLRYLQQMFYKFIQINGKVSWKQISQFLSDKSEPYNTFDIFFPLYNVGLVDVCWQNNQAYYFAPTIKLQTSNPLLGTIKSNPKFPDFRIYPEDCSVNKKQEKEIALSILKKIPDVLTIMRKWTKVSIDTDYLEYGFSFGSSDGIDTPRYKKIINDINFTGLCRKSIDKRLMALEPAYFKFSRGEVYQIPNRNINPNAERIAKIAMRSLSENLPKRFDYYKSKNELNCFLSDIPIPVLRALFICDPVKLANPDLYLNKKEMNKFSFTVSDDIYEELKRILTANVFEEY